MLSNYANLRIASVKVAGSLVLLIVVAALGMLAQSTNERVNDLRDRIPQANPAKYRSVTDATTWKNPFLTVQPSGVDVRASNANREPTVPAKNIIDCLSKLPITAWPYGLVVAVGDAGARDGSKATDASIKRNRQELLRYLHDAGVKAELWPSA